MQFTIMKLLDFYPRVKSQISLSSVQGTLSGFYLTEDEKAWLIYFSYYIYCLSSFICVVCLPSLSNMLIEMCICNFFFYLAMSEKKLTIS